jgi:hypothetical protein
LDLVYAWRNALKLPLQTNSGAINALIHPTSAPSPSPSPCKRSEPDRFPSFHPSSIHFLSKIKIKMAAPTAAAPRPPGAKTRAASPAAEAPPSALRAFPGAALRVVLRPTVVFALLAVALLPVGRALRLVWALVALPFVVAVRLSVSGSGRWARRVL